MSDYVFRSPLASGAPFIPNNLGELDDLLASMMLEAPTFVDRLGFLPDQTIDSRFHQLDTALSRVKPKLGAESYAKAVDLSVRAKALFLSDADMTNGKTKEGIWLLDEISKLITDARRRRVKAKLRDDEGEVTGD